MNANINNLLEQLWEDSKSPPNIFLVPSMKRVGRKYYRFSIRLNKYVRVYKKYGFNIKQHNGGIK